MFYFSKIELSLFKKNSYSSQNYKKKFNTKSLYLISFDSCTFRIFMNLITLCNYIIFNWHKNTIFHHHFAFVYIAIKIMSYKIDLNLVFQFLNVKIKSCCDYDLYINKILS